MAVMTKGRKGSRSKVTALQVMAASTRSARFGGGVVIIFEQVTAKSLFFCPGKEENRGFNVQQPPPAEPPQHPSLIRPAPAERSLLSVARQAQRRRTGNPTRKTG